MSIFFSVRLKTIGVCFNFYHEEITLRIKIAKANVDNHLGNHIASAVRAAVYYCETWILSQKYFGCKYWYCVALEKEINSPGSEFFLCKMKDLYQIIS